MEIALYLLQDLFKEAPIFMSVIVSILFAVIAIFVLVAGAIIIHAYRRLISIGITLADKRAEKG